MKFKKVLTGDGSYSLHSSEFDELMHTTHGAYTESVEKHIKPSGLCENTSKQITILDVGFGLGYNILASLCEISKKENPPILNIYSLEKDRSAVSVLKNLKFSENIQLYYNDILEAFETGSYKSEKYNIYCLFGDARSSIKELIYKNSKFDIVFQDPFSPGKNSELWTVQYFKNIFQIMNEESIMTTYSTALQVRRAMLEAGFHIGQFRPDKVEKTGTIARKITFDGELADTDAIYENLKSTPYRDQNFDLDRNIILQNRLDEMRNIRMLRADHPIQT